MKRADTGSNWPCFCLFIMGEDAIRMWELIVFEPLGEYVNHLTKSISHYVNSTFTQIVTQLSLFNVILCYFQG